ASICASAVCAQTGSPGSATLSGSKSTDCPEIIAGQVNMPDIIEQAGSADEIYRLSQAQIAEYERWFVEMEAARGQGIREAEIEALIAQGEVGLDIEQQISEAALCYMSE